MEGRAVSVEALMRELQKQQLLTQHLNQSGSASRRGESDIRVRAATAGQQPKHCFGFQKGNCTRADCPYLHEKSPEAKSQDQLRAKPKSKPSSVSKKPSLKKPSSKKKGAAKPRRSLKPNHCTRCGAAHPLSECKFTGQCEYCHKPNHKAAVCKKKLYDDGRAHVAFTTPSNDVLIRRACVPRGFSLVWSTVQPTGQSTSSIGQSSQSTGQSCYCLPRPPWCHTINLRTRWVNLLKP